MPEDIADPGTAAGGAEGGDQSGVIDTADAVVDDNAGDSTDSPDAGDEVDEEAEAAALLAKDEEGKDKETVDEEEPPAEDPDAAKEKVEPKSIGEARAHIEKLEGQLANANQTHEKVLEIGGLPVLEMAMPLIDVVMNPEAKAGEIIEAIAAINGQHNAQDLAWGLVDENREAVVAHFCGDDITPEILEKLVDKFTNGEIELDDDADDVFLDPAEKAAKAAAAKEKPDADGKKAAKEAQEATLATARTEAIQSVGKLCEDAVSSVLKPYAVAETDSKEVKALKSFLNDSVQAQVMFALSTDPVFNRVQKLIKGNGIGAANALAKGSLAVSIAKRAEALTAQFQPFAEAAITKAAAGAKKISKVREEPSGASTQSDVMPQKDEELDPKDPKWREKLDAQYSRKISRIVERGRGTRRNHTGQFSGTGK